MAKPSGYLKRREAQRKQMIEAGKEIAQVVKEETAEDLLKLVVIALNDEFGLGRDRLKRLADTLHRVTEDWYGMAEADVQYARVKLDQRIKQIFGDEEVAFRLKY